MYSPDKLRGLSGRLAQSHHKKKNKNKKLYIIYI